MRLPLAISTTGHAAALAALVILARALPPPLIQPPQKRFEIALNAPAAQIETVRPVAPSEPVVEPVQPPPERRVQPEPERRITAVEPPPKRLPRPPIRPRPRPAVPPPPGPEPEPGAYEPAAPAAPSPPERAPAPAAYEPAPRPDLEAGYKAALSRWFEIHKRYPASARENNEEGNAVVQFRVDPSGRVLSFSLAKSTGYPDLDQAVTELLDGAQLPPFPPGLTLSSLDIAVTLRFSLTR